jgi:inhibitor of cysteine peptidase
MQSIQLSEADSGRRIQLHRGDHVVIRLDSNPTTGFNWEMQPNTDFAVSQRHLVNAEGGMGASGGDVFELTAKSSAQNGSLGFFYRRPWEDASKTEKKFVVEYEIL